MNKEQSMVIFQTILIPGVIDLFHRLLIKWCSITNSSNISFYKFDFLLSKVLLLFESTVG